MAMGKIGFHTEHQFSGYSPFLVVGMYDQLSYLAVVLFVCIGSNGTHYPVI